MRNEDIEKRCFEKFKNVYKIPKGTVAFGDKPDIVVEGEEKLGIEVRLFYKEDGAQSFSEQRQKKIRERLLNDVRNQYEKAGGKNLQVTVSFDLSIKIDKEKEYVIKRELIKVIQKSESLKAGSVPYLYFQKIPELKNIHIYPLPPNEPAKWIDLNAYSLDFLSSEKINEIIREKELKAKHYDLCDTYWLLLVINSFDVSQD